MTFPRGFAPDTNTEEEEMNPKLMRNALRMMIVLLAVIGLTDVVAAAGADAALNGSGYFGVCP